MAKICKTVDKCRFVYLSASFVKIMRNIFHMQDALPRQLQMFRDLPPRTDQALRAPRCVCGTGGGKLYGIAPGLRREMLLIEPVGRGTVAVNCPDIRRLQNRRQVIRQRIFYAAV